MDPSCSLTRTSMGMSRGKFKSVCVHLDLLGYEILSVSKHSVNRPDYLQKEMKDAMNIWAERSANRPFLIPVRFEPTG
jgi:hypothetical protein